MSWNIVAFESKRGEKPVKQFIFSLESHTQAKITHIIDLLEVYGPSLGMPHIKKLTDKLYEARIKGKEEIRIVFAYKARTIYLLHGFKKKTQKISTKEIEIAKKRLDII